MDTRFPLFTRHGRPLSLLYSEVEAYALQQDDVFLGTAGSVVERTNASGFRYYAHSFYDAEGTKRERYVGGPVGAADAEALAAALRERIRELKELVPSLRLLGREGFSLVDARTYSTLAALHNHRVFAGGALLVGSHAFGILLNHLGVKAVPYRTEDIDIARGGKLALPAGRGASLLDMLRQTGIEFVEVPQLDHDEPATSYKQRGRSLFRVDLLVPVPGEATRIVAVPELAAHATGLPFLGYLLADSQQAPALAREGCCTVRAPLPERFVVHKLIVSRLRPGRSAKSERDLFQAAVVGAATAESHPGALAEAVRDVPRRAAKYLRLALAAAEPLFASHGRAWDELTG